jgi:hypothetical protein
LRSLLTRWTFSPVSRSPTCHVAMHAFGRHSWEAYTSALMSLTRLVLGVKISSKCCG